MFNILQDYVNKLIRAQAERLEEEAKLFVKMGYEPEELLIVMFPDGSKEVSPKSALEE